MPLIKRAIQPQQLCRVEVPKGVQDDLEFITNSSLSKIILQLSSLSLLAEDLFNELHRDTVMMFSRVETLAERVDKMSTYVSQLDPMLEELEGVEAFQQKQQEGESPWRPEEGCHLDQQLVGRVTRPTALNHMYCHCQPIPALHILDPYRDDGRSSSKFYTDPDQFLEHWINEMMISNQSNQSSADSGTIRHSTVQSNSRQQQQQSLQHQLQSQQLSGINDMQTHQHVQQQVNQRQPLSHAERELFDSKQTDAWSNSTLPLNKRDEKIICNNFGTIGRRPEHPGALTEENQQQQQQNQLLHQQNQIQLLQQNQLQQQIQQQPQHLPQQQSYQLQHNQHKVNGNHGPSGTNGYNNDDNLQMNSRTDQNLAGRGHTVRADDHSVKQSDSFDLPPPPPNLSSNGDLNDVDCLPPPPPHQASIPPPLPQLLHDYGASFTARYTLQQTAAESAAADTAALVSRSGTLQRRPSNSSAATIVAAAGNYAQNGQQQRLNGLSGSGSGIDRDKRSNLLSAIRQGQQLKQIQQLSYQPPRNQPHCLPSTQQMPAGHQQLSVGQQQLLPMSLQQQQRFDVQSVMEAVFERRRRAMDEDSDDHLEMHGGREGSWSDDDL